MAKRILLIAGSPGLANALKAALESEGHMVCIEAGADTGRNKAKSEDFDAVIIAICWKGSDKTHLDPSRGLHLVNDIHTDKSHLPVIVIASEYDGNSTMAQAILQRDFDCLPEPTNQRAMAQFLAKVCKASRILKSEECVSSNPTAPVMGTGGKHGPIRAGAALMNTGEPRDPLSWWPRIKEPVFFLAILASYALALLTAILSAVLALWFQLGFEWYLFLPTVVCLRLPAALRFLLAPQQGRV